MYGGVDVKTHPDVGSAEACCSLCGETPACQYWSWAEAHVAQGKTCWLKGSREHRLEQSGFVSGRGK